MIQANGYTVIRSTTDARVANANTASIHNSLMYVTTHGG